MIQRTKTPPTINLSREPGELPLLVDMEAFFELSFWLAEELEDLIATYQHKQMQAKPGSTADK